MQQFLEEGATGKELVDLECAACRKRRHDRNRVLRERGEQEQNLKQPPFDVALSLYAYNIPRYYTIMLRAKDFARVHQRRLRWCVARDVPLHRDDRDLPVDQLDAKRQRWLLMHDQDTAHLASSLPLVPGLPVRLTETVDRGKFLFRGRRGKIYGWAPHPEETSEDVDGILLLDRLPQTVYVEFPGATWVVDDLPPGVHPVPPASRTWVVNKHTKVKARRTGFFLVPDFASTAHMIQGQSLDAASADVVNDNMLEQATEELHVTAYVMLSRAKFLHQLWVMQPFGRQLFARGPPLGPNLLLQKLRGEITPEDAMAKFDEAGEDGKPKKKADPMTLLFSCTACRLGGRRDHEKPPVAFGAYCQADIATHIVAKGAWARCLACQEVAETCRLKARRLSLAEADGITTKAPTRDASNTVQCATCKLDRPKTFFMQSVLAHKARAESRGTTLQCNVCRGVRHCEGCSGWRQLKVFRPGQLRCKACQPLCCANCGQFKAPAMYTEQDRKHYFSHGLKVSCQACKDEGHTARAGQHRGAAGLTTRQCKGCLELCAESSFRNEKGVLQEVCMQCEMITCNACEDSKNRFAFTATNVRNHFSYKRLVVCKECEEKGCSSADPRYYWCMGPCQQPFGHSLFDKAQLQAHRKDNRRLCCKTCDREEKQREKQLKQRIRNSKEVCKCAKQVYATRMHKEVCFLHQRPQNYMWMDKLKASNGGREDSDWLLERMRRGK